MYGSGCSGVDKTHELAYNCTPVCEQNLLKSPHFQLERYQDHLKPTSLAKNEQAL
jgi:hypothetical protein